MQTHAPTDELPTTLFRSDAAVEPEAENLYDCRRDAAVLQAVVTALKDRRERRHGDGQAASGTTAAAAGTGGRAAGGAQPQAKPGRPPLPAAAAAAAAEAAAAMPAPVDADDDIFADAGREYVPAPKTEAPPGAAKPPARGPVFGGNQTAVLPPPPAGAAEPGAGGDVAPRSEKSARLARMLAGEEEDDAYGELYPMGGQHMTYAGIGADSDDEGDGGKTKLGGKKGKPGAGGAGDDDDAKPMDPKQRAQQVEKKLDTQLRGVQRALEEKHGDKHKTAFGAGGGGRGRGGAKREGEGEPQPVAKDRAKRLRLD